MKSEMAGESGLNVANAAGKIRLRKVSREHLMTL
jgi:hypothetical protein